MKHTLVIVEQGTRVECTCQWGYTSYTKDTVAVYRWALKHKEEFTPTIVGV